MVDLDICAPFSNIFVDCTSENDHTDAHILVPTKAPLAEVAIEKAD